MIRESSQEEFVRIEKVERSEIKIVIAKTVLIKWMNSEFGGF